MLEWFTAETIVDSTIEPEYIDACEAAKEAVWACT